MSPNLDVTLQELETHWSVLDLLNAHVALDVMADMEEQAMKKRKELTK